MVRSRSLTEVIMAHTARLPFASVATSSLQAMIHLSNTISQSSVGQRILELVNLRVSQVNGCGVCVDMHWHMLIKQGADPRHLNAIAGWREASFFDPRERAALAWADAMNALPQRDETDAAYREVSEHFSDTEIAEISYCVAVIRGWNVLNIALRNQIPEHPIQAH